jgi:hypothetical protein
VPGKSSKRSRDFDRLGMMQVANFTLGGEVFIVLSTRNANLVRK